jgi:hypothetical protein
MSSHERRVRAIQLTLTPKQIVILWLRNARAGNLLEAPRNPKSPREMIAISVSETVQKSMNGEAEPLIEHAILQARKEADSLYNLIVRVNSAVFESVEQCEREHILLARYLHAVIDGKCTKDRIQYLRSSILTSIEPVIILDAAINQVVAERLSGQTALFRDAAVLLGEMLEMVTNLSRWFNVLTPSFGRAEINLEDLRRSLQAEIDRRINIWVGVARLKTLALLGERGEFNSALTRYLALIDREAGDRNDVV